MEIGTRPNHTRAVPAVLGRGWDRSRRCWGAEAAAPNHPQYSNIKSSSREIISAVGALWPVVSAGAGVAGAGHLVPIIGGGKARGAWVTTTRLSDGLAGLESAGARTRKRSPPV